MYPLLYRYCTASLCPDTFISSHKEPLEQRHSTICTDLQELGHLSFPERSMHSVQNLHTTRPFPALTFTVISGLPYMYCHLLASFF